MTTWGRHRRPLIIAHRGASAERPENTLAAFRLAVEQGADGVELDVMRCASGEVVVFHDDDLKRLAGRPESIRALTWSQLREVRVGGEPIPTLEEVLEALESVGPRTLVNIELKAPDHRGLAHTRELRDDGLAFEVAAIARRAQLGQRALVSSFHPLLLARFRRAAPEIATGILIHHDLRAPLRDAWLAPLLRPAALHPEAVMVTRRAVQQWHRQGRAVNVWTVDDPAELRFLAAVGVDGIITNTPGAARTVLGAISPAQRSSSS